MTATSSVGEDRTTVELDRSDRSTRSWIAWTGAATAVLSTAAVLLDAPSWSRLATVLAFACAGPGAAIMVHVPVVRPSTSWALTNVLSLSIWAIGSALSAWLNDWSPTTLLLVLAVGTLVSVSVAWTRTRQVTR